MSRRAASSLPPLLLAGLLLGGTAYGSPAHLRQEGAGTAASPLVAWASFDPPSYSFGTGAPGSFNATANVTGGIPPYQVAWDFGAGTAPVPGTRARFAPAGPGEYLAVLSASDARGHRATSLVHLFSGVQDAPVGVSASANPSIGLAPLTVAFFWGGAGGTSGNQPTGPTWTFGDGARGVGPSASHTYSTPGSYSAELRTSTATGLSATYSLSIVVVGPDSPFLVTTNSVSGDPCVPSSPTTFESSEYGGVPPFSYVWNFSDGSPPSMSPDPTHLLNGNASQPPGLVVSDARGDTGTSRIAQEPPFPGPPPFCPPRGTVPAPWGTALILLATGGGVVAISVVAWSRWRGRRRSAPPVV
jgi:PKD domain